METSSVVQAVAATIQEFKMESDNRLPTGEWNGFYLENHQPNRGWMHLYMSFSDGKIRHDFRQRDYGPVEHFFHDWRIPYLAKGHEYA